MQSPLIFLPGFACRPWIWDSIIEGLHRPFRAIAWPEGNTLQELTEAILPEITSDAVVIGHSMGGLVGLELLERQRIHRLVLVETFITPPPPFFQNLMLPDHPLLTRVQAMLKEEKAHYPSSLADSLKCIDSLSLASKHSSNIMALYGDRGTSDGEQVYQNLGWPDSLNIPVRIIPQACHFPMLENPTAVKRVMQEIL